MHTIERRLLALCLIAVAVNRSDQMQNDALRAVSSGTSQFSSAFFQAVAEQEKGNLITSPLSASIVLAMLAYGAAGNTNNILKRALHLPLDDANGKSGYQYIIDSLNAIDTVELAVANSVFVNNEYPIKPSYTEMIHNSFRSRPESVSFKYSEQAANIINSWVKANTKDRIQTIVNAADLDERTALVLVNAVYFKGKWKTEFNPALTRPLPFYVNSNYASNVPTMYQKGEFKYAELPELKAKLLELPYKGEEISMIIILPDDIDGLSEVERKLEGKDLSELTARSSLHDVGVYLPRFRIESTIDLEPTLKRLGLENIFSDNANLSGISDVPLSVSKVVQKAFIEVKEEGSEAAAATGLSVRPLSSVWSPPKPIVFRVDRPFLSIIKHGNIILFLANVKS